jgi:hypothetical protein
MKVLVETMINGGSIRCYATHITNFKFKSWENTKTLDTLRQEEFDLELDTDKPYRNFQNELITTNKNYRPSEKSQTRRQPRLWRIDRAYILQWCGIDHAIIDCAATGTGQGRAKTIGTDIPIVSEKIRAMKPDYLVPWHFRENFC